MAMTQEWAIKPWDMDLWVMCCPFSSKVRDAGHVQLYIVEISEVNLELCNWLTLT